MFFQLSYPKASKGPSILVYHNHHHQINHPFSFSLATTTIPPLRIPPLRIVVLTVTCSSYFQTRYPLALEATIGIVGLLVTGLTLKVVETFNEPLPQTMADFKALKHKSRKNSFWR